MRRTKNETSYSIVSARFGVRIFGMFFKPGRLYRYNSGGSNRLHRIQHKKIIIKSQKVLRVFSHGGPTVLEAPLKCQDPFLPWQPIFEQPQPMQAAKRSIFIHNFMLYCFCHKSSDPRFYQRSSFIHV